MDVFLEIIILEFLFFVVVFLGIEEFVGDIKKKIDILLKVVGDIFIMKIKKWVVE